VQKWREENSGKAGDVAWSDAELCEVPGEDEVVEDEHDPAQADEEEYWAEASEDACGEGSFGCGL